MARVEETKQGDSSLGYKLLLSCPSGLSPSQLSVNFSEEHDRIPHADHALEDSIAQIWEQRTHGNSSLFNGLKFRYGSYVSDYDGGSNEVPQVCLHLGLTDYRTFVGTNLSPMWEGFLVPSEDDPIRCQHTSSPLGNGAITETSDNKIIVLRRSNNVGEFPGHYVFPGGHPEPNEVGIISHQLGEDAATRELVNKKVAQEMFDSIIREVVEETGVPASSLSSPLFIGLSRRKLNARPAAFFFIKCSLHSEEIQRLYSNAEDGFESTQLHTVSMTELEKMASGMTGCHRGGFALHKLMEQLRNEIAATIEKLGRVSVIDLADTIGVDLYHVEKQAQDVVSNDPGLLLVQGEIISQTYWDSIAEEINERLQECSQIAVAEIAAQLQVGSELVQAVLEPRLGTLVKARLEGGQLYTPAYVARVTAMVRGSARGVFVPSNLSALWMPLQQLVQEMNGASGVAVENSFFQSLFNRLLKEEEMLGSLRAGTHWTPSAFAIAQKESVDSFFSQNSFITYETMQKLGISQVVQFLQSRYPEGTPLAAVFVHPSMVEMLDAATEDAVERNSWIDSLTVLPTSFTSQDAYKMLLLCPSVQSALKANKALILSETFVLSSGFIKGIYDQIEKDAETFSAQVSAASLIDHSSKSSESTETIVATEKGSKKKKGKSAGAKAVTIETALDEEEEARPKSRRNQKKGKDALSSQMTDSKAGGKKGSAKVQEVNHGIPSDEWILQKITNLVPEFEEQGIDNLESILKHLVDHMKPMLVNSVKERRKKLFTENAERMKRLLDDLPKKLDESYLNMQLYEKALELFEDDQSTSVVLHRHLLRTTAAYIADTLLHDLDIHHKLKNGIEVEESKDKETVMLDSSGRTALAKNFTGSLSKKALSLVEVLEGKRVDTFMNAFRDMAEESGLVLKKLDKKLERTLLHSYRKDLISQVSTESDPVALLAKVVSLLYIQVHSKALQAPGRAIASAISHLKDKLDESAYKTLTEYQTATVTLLALVSASTGEEDDCSGDRILSKREFLESQMPQLKSLVLPNSSQSSS